MKRNMKRMKIMAVCSFLLLGGLSGRAAESADTVVVIDKPERVVFTDRGNRISLDIQEKDPMRRFTYVKQLNPGKSDTLVVRERSDWEISLPFITKKKRKSHNFDGHWAGIGFGVCNAAHTATGGLNGQRGVNTTMGNSYEICWNIINFDFAPWKNGWGLVSGIGIDWRNYRMTGHERFVKKNDNLQVENYPEGADIEFSRIKTFSVTVPALIEWQSPRGRNSYFFSAGAIVCLNTYGSVKTRYKLEGKKYKEFDKNIHENPLTVDFTVMAGIRGFGAYFKYSPCNVLQTDYGPRFSAMSAGLLCFF